MTAPLVSLDAIRRAADRVRGVARLTPLVPASTSDEWSHLWVKCENLQAIGAFKVRGAYNFLAALDPEERARGVVTYSSGNHGQAVAFAARRLGTSAVVVMPTTAAPIKVEGARALGAEMHFAGTVSIERQAAAEAIQRERGLTMVPPFDHPDIIAGQGTIGLEVVDQQPAVTARLCANGRRWPDFRRSGSDQRVAPRNPRGWRRACWCAEDECVAGGRSPDDARSRRLDGRRSAGGAARRPQLRARAALVDEIITVTEDEIRDAMRFLARHTKIVAEPSGAVSVAGALRLAPAGSRGVHVAVVSGGNAEIRADRANCLREAGQAAR